MAGQVTCRSRVSASSGNHSRTSSCHSCSLFAGPPGLIPAATAGAMYFRSVLRSAPRLCDISLSDRPACQCTSISVTSITSNVLLAIGLPSQTGGKTAPSRWPDPPRHARRPHGELRDRGGELRDRYPLRAGELRERRQLGRISQGLGAAVRRCADGNEIPWVVFRKGDRRLEVMRPYLDAAERAG